MFAKRKRRKLARRHLDEAIAERWESLGVEPRGYGATAWREATVAAGLGAPGEPDYTRLALSIVSEAVASLSDEDRFIATGGREGKDPFAA